MRAFQWFGVGVLIIILLVLLFGCASLTQMSDDWCERHPSAGENRCWGHKPQMSWDQESLSKAANVMACPDHNYVFGTDDAGNLKECL